MYQSFLYRVHCQIGAALKFLTEGKARVKMSTAIAYVY